MEPVGSSTTGIFGTFFILVHFSVSSAEYFRSISVDVHDEQKAEQSALNTKNVAFPFSTTKINSAKNDERGKDGNDNDELSTLQAGEWASSSPKNISYKHISLKVSLYR